MEFFWELPHNVQALIIEKLNCSWSRPNC
jgi:hypothetical protein